MMDNYKRSLIRYKFIELNELPAVEYTEITLNERFSNQVHYSCLPAFDTRWKDPKKIVKRVYFTNYSEGLSKRFSAISNSAISMIDTFGKLGNTQWWTTGCQWIPLPEEQIHSTSKLLFDPHSLVTSNQTLNEQIGVMKNQRTVSLPKSLTTVPRNMDSFNKIGTATTTTMRRASKRYLPYRKRFPRKRSKSSSSDLRSKLLDLELDKYMASCLKAKTRTEATFQKNLGYKVLLPKLLVEFPGRHSSGKEDDGTMSPKQLPQKHFAGISANFKKRVERYLREGMDMRKKQLGDDLDKYMGDLQITKIQPMEA